MDIRERLQFVVDRLFDGSRRSFALRIEISPGTVDNVLGSRASKPSVEILEKMMKHIEALNAEWLLTGKGMMTKNELGDQSSIPTTDRIALTAMAEKINRLENENRDLRVRLGIEERSVV